LFQLGAMRMWNRFVFICPVAVIFMSVVKFEEGSVFLRSRYVSKKTI
jgi:hypothetical protein